MERTLDYKGRWRNHTVAFRVSDEESKLLNDLVALSSLTKQDYITRRLTSRLEEVLEENRELRIVAVDFGRIKAVVGSEQVIAVINRAKQQEQIEGEQKRAARRKHNREAR